MKPATLKLIAEWLLVAAAAFICYLFCHVTCKPVKTEGLCINCSNTTLAFAIIARFFFWMRGRKKYNSKPVIR